MALNRSWLGRLDQQAQEPRALRPTMSRSRVRVSERFEVKAPMPIEGHRGFAEFSEPRARRPRIPVPALRSHVRPARFDGDGETACECRHTP